MVTALHRAADEIALCTGAPAKPATAISVAGLAGDLEGPAGLPRSAVLANMSHEISTPLNAILGAAELLSETMLDKDQRQYVSLLKRNGAHLLTLVNDLQDLSRIHGGPIEPHREPFLLREVLDEAMDAVALAAREKGLDMVIRVSPLVRDHVLGDRGRLRRVLGNLLDNTVKFTERGQVIVTVEPDPRSSASGALLFSVRDTGIGIAREHLDIIFEPFFQVDASSTRHHGGLGLGLTICRWLVHVMGGRIWAESEPGQGTAVRFTVTLEPSPEEAPRAAPPAAVPAASQEAVIARPLNILLVDDHPDNCLVVQSYLKGTPHRLSVAENGAAAVEMFKRGSFDLVLMDIQMPVMDGYGATHAMRAHERESGRPRVPILALTVHSMSEDVERARRAGCDAHLTKPISKSVLLSALEATSPPVLPRDESLLSAIDPDLLDLVPSYIQNRFRDLAACHSHLPEGRFAEIRVLAHGMAGSGGAYGFDEITRLGRALQTAAGGRDGEACARLLAELEDYVRRVHAACSA